MLLLLNRRGTSQFVGFSVQNNGTAGSAAEPGRNHLSGDIAARIRTSSSGRNTTPTSSKARWRAPKVAASGRCRSSSKLSITLAGTEAALASLLRDQLSKVRAERHWAAVIMDPKFLV